MLQAQGCDTPVDAFKRDYRRFCIPVFESSNGKEYFSASSFILTKASKYYLVTAKHVFFDFDNNKIALRNNVSWFFGCSSDAFSTSALTYHDSKDWDFVFCKIDKQIVDSIIGRNYSPIPYELLDCSNSIHMRKLYCHGFPSSRNKVRIKPREDALLIGNYAYLDDGSVVWIDFDKSYVLLTNNEIGKSVKTNGMSGGPIWEISVDSGQILFRLKGLFTGYYDDMKKLRGEWLMNIVKKVFPDYEPMES